MARDESRASVLVGPTGIAVAGHVPGRVVWLVAAAVGLEQVDPSLLKSLYDVHRVRRKEFDTSAYKILVVFCSWYQSDCLPLSLFNLWFTIENSYLYNIS